jgi:hypothetical protein
MIVRVTLHSQQGDREPFSDMHSFLCFRVCPPSCFARFAPPARSSNPVRSRSFSSAPATYDMSRKLSKQKSRKSSAQLNERTMADQHMLRRMDAYPLPAQRKQNPHDATAHPVKLFRDAGDPAFTHSPGISANGGLGLPPSPRRLYSSTASGQMRPVSAGGNTGVMSQSSGRSSSRHPPQHVFTADHFASAVPRKDATSREAYKRPSQELMEYTSGRGVARRAVPTDVDEMEPGRRSPRLRPASATNRPRGSQPHAVFATAAMRPASAHPSSDRGNYDPIYGDYARASASAAEAADAYDGGSVGADPYVKLRHKLFALIVEHRIFREKAILQLLDKAKRINAHLNQFKLDRVLEEIRIEFEIPPTAQLSSPTSSQSNLHRNLSQSQLLAKQKSALSSLNRDVKEEALQGKLERLERSKSERERELAEEAAAESRSRSRSHSRSRSASPFASRSRSRSHSRSRSPSRSRSRSPRERKYQY